MARPADKKTRGQKKGTDPKAAAKEARAKERAAKRKAKQARRAAKPRSRAAAELRKNGWALAGVAVLFVLSLVAAVVPAWSIPVGTFLAGGNQVTLTATASDGSAPSSDDVTAAAKNLQVRADGLKSRGVSVKKTGDDTIAVRVPSKDDASSIAQSLTATGKVELARVDSISDADALAQLTAGTTDVTLTEGTYTPFATNDDITDARVVESTSSYSSTPIYAVGFTLKGDAADQLASITDELKDSSGKIAVIVDGTVITAPSVSSKIEGGKVTFSGGFTEDQAYALAAEFNAGPINVTLTAGDAGSLGVGLWGFASAAAVLSVAVLAILVGLVCTHVLKLGPTGWLAADSLVVTLVLQIGILTVLAQFGYVILGNWELIALGISAVVAAVSSAAVCWSYRHARAQGSSVRKAQQDALDTTLERFALAEAVLAVVLIAVAFLLPNLVVREFSWALAAGLTADLLTMPLFKAPMLKVFTVDDVEDSADVRVKLAPAGATASGDAASGASGAAGADKTEGEE